MASPQSRLKSLRLRWFLIRRIFLDLTNVSVQVILFPLNLVLGDSLIFFWHGKENYSDDVDSVDSLFVWHVGHIASVMAADSFKLPNFFQ